MASQNGTSIYDGNTFLTDVKIPDPNVALVSILTGQTGNLRNLLSLQAVKGKLLYQGKVAKKTGRLEESAQALVEMREVKKGEARLCGVITVGGELPVSTWKGEPFFYGALHNFGRDPSDSGTFHPAHNDLVDVRNVLAQ